MSEPPAIPDDRLFATAPETAVVLRVDHRTVLKMCETGQIPAIRTGRIWRVPTSWLRKAAGLGARDATA
jgi:excisionase family DNA binding protein